MSGWGTGTQLRASSSGLGFVLGFMPELLRQCVAAGAHKIKVNRLVLDNYYEHLESSVGRMPQMKLMEEGVEEVVRQTMEWMEFCGLAGKAVAKSMS